MASQSAMKNNTWKLNTNSVMENWKQNLWREQKVWKKICDGRRKLETKKTSLLGFMGFAWVRGGKAQSGKRQNYASTFYFD